MEKIQERALRFVYEGYESTYDILLKKGNHDLLYIGRLRNMVTEIFKALHVLLQFILEIFLTKRVIFIIYVQLYLKCNQRVIQ